MGEKIKKECLSVDNDRVFVSYSDDLLRTATREYYRKYKDSAWVGKLHKSLSMIPKPGQRLRITLWHHGVIAKVEVRVSRKWEPIYEIEELPRDLHCLAEH